MTKFFIFSLLAIFITNVSSANIFRVNNNLVTDPTQKIYNTILEANNAAAVAAGDTLMVEGSTSEYPSTTINKRLILIGPGYFLTSNPQTQASPLQAVLKAFTFNIASSGSVLMGFTFSTGSTAYAPVVQSNNIIIMKCYLPNPINFVQEISNVQIIQNYFTGVALSLGSTVYTFSQVILSNNYIAGNLSIPSSDTYQRIFSAVENNIFNGSVAITTSTFRSNIIVPTTGTVTVLSGAIQNNLVSNGQLPATDGNQTYNAANLFVGLTGNSNDGQYKLKPTSPYLTAGYNNTQPGIYGGAQSYVLSGMPAIPSIYEFTADGVANKQAGLPVNIKVKANQ